MSHFDPEQTRPGAQDDAAESWSETTLREETLPAGKIVAGRYRVIELLGTGGMGAVYKAEHIHMKKDVALKVLHREMTILPEVVQRFEREAVAAGRIGHPNVVQARDFGRLENGAYYLVLEFVEGQSLSSVLERERFTVDRCLSIAKEVAEALAAAHEQKVVHRDLKPDNVMLLASRGEMDRIKVLDFGIAKVDVRERGQSQRPLTRMGSVFGTPEYMAPEQAAGQGVDHRADIYSLGLLLYRMLAGAPPFQADSINAVLMKQITQEPPPLDVRIPAEVRDLVARLLRKSPAERPQSVAEVASEIVRLLSENPQGLSFVPEGLNPVLTAETRVDARSKVRERVPLSIRLDRGFLGKPVNLLGNQLPFWRLVILLLVMGSITTGLVLLLRMAPAPATAATAQKTTTLQKTTAPHTTTPPEPVEVHAGLLGSVELLVNKPEATAAENDVEVREEVPEKILAEAFAGKPQALALLEERPAQQRTLREWLALGRGYFKTGRESEGLVAYRVALERDPKLAQGPALKRDVWFATKKQESVEAALQLAADRLEASGADILYKYWVETRDVNSGTQLARKLLQQESVRKHASPALAFALEWREAMNCDDYRQLLPQAALNGDTRALTLFQRALDQNDCELPQEALEAAISAVKDRPAPPYN